MCHRHNWVKSVPWLGRRNIPVGPRLENLEDLPCRTWEDAALSSVLHNRQKEKAWMASSISLYIYDLWMQNF